MSDAASKVSFLSKNATECPVCGFSVYREELFTGRGRLIAGDLTEDLRRIYEPSKKYGEVHPLIYSIMVCPQCYYSSFVNDFEGIKDSMKGKLKKESDRRIEEISLILPDLDFSQPRRIQEGIASYFFALMCYDHFSKEYSPTIKQGIAALRSAWLFHDLHAKFPRDNYDYLAKLFYRKAAFFYSLAVEYEGSGKEPITNAGHLGPDLDKNYGYDGVLYLAAYLEYKYGVTEDEERRIESLKTAKTTVARIFGMGKASKDKPTALLDKSKELYARINELLKSGELDENPEN